MDVFLNQLSSLLGPSVQRFVTLALVFVPLEFAFTLRPAPLVRRQLWPDVGFFFLNSLLPGLLLAWMLSALMPLVKPLYGAGLYTWMAALPLWFKFPIAILIGDIGSYWGHRWSHEWPLLWRFHRIHHQAEHIDWLVTSRGHPFDTAFLKFSGLVLIYLCGFAQGSLGQGTPLMAIYVTIVTFWGVFIHANVHWRFGAIEHWLATPAFHHWHHANESQETIDRNYAAIFPFVDRLFGTLHLPSRRWPASCGLRVETTPDEPHAASPAPEG